MLYSNRCFIYGCEQCCKALLLYLLLYFYHRLPKTKRKFQFLLLCIKLAGCYLKVETSVKVSLEFIENIYFSSLQSQNKWKPCFDYIMCGGLVEDLRSSNDHLFTVLYPFLHGGVRERTSPPPFDNEI
jgi:hypothetical protein